jgi:RNA polymerase sigma-70 factor (ECF subfamily)
MKGSVSLRGAGHPIPLSADALFRAHATFVALFLARLGARRDDVEDLVQEVFLVAHLRGGYVEASARPTTWLAEIALRILQNARRAGRRSRLENDDLAIAAAVETGAGPDGRAEGAEELALVQLALDDLKREERALFVLHEIEGQACSAIATDLGIPIGTVYSRLNAARAAFLKAYRRQSACRSSPYQRRGNRSTKASCLRQVARPCDELSRLSAYDEH